MKFQHNQNIEITKESYNYMMEYKKQLLFNITNLLNDLHIRFVISHGNLIEYERKSPIHRDDDLDIRMNVQDLSKWENFCNKNNRELTKYNLVFDSRFNKIKSQKINGIQCWLIKFNNKRNIKKFNMDIHCDLVSSVVKTDFWMNYNIDYSNLRLISYLDVNTYAPNINHTKYILTKQYGKNYLIPNHKSAF